MPVKAFPINMFPVPVTVNLVICCCLLQAGLVSGLTADSYEINTTKTKPVAE